jgi:hypothetical protein
MSQTTFLVLLVLSYSASAVFVSVYSMYAMRAWTTAYKGHRPIYWLAAWHPGIAIQWFGRHKPRRPAGNEDWAGCVFFALMPGLNTVMTVTLVVAISLDFAGESLRTLSRSVRSIQFRG